MLDRAGRRLAGSTRKASSVLADKRIIEGRIVGGALHWVHANPSMASVSWKSQFRRAGTQSIANGALD